MVRKPAKIRGITNTMRMWDQHLSLSLIWLLFRAVYFLLANTPSFFPPDVHTNTVTLTHLHTNSGHRYE